MAGTIALAPSRLGPRGLRLPRQSDLRALLVALLTAALIASVLTVAENPFAIDAATTSQEGSVSSAVDVADDLTTGSSQSVLPGEVPDGLTANEWADIQAQIAARQAGSTAVTAQPVPLVQAPTTVVPLTVVPTPLEAAPVGRVPLALPAAAAMSSAGVNAAFTSTGATFTTASSSIPVGLSTSVIGSDPASAAVVVETAVGVELFRGVVTEYFHAVPEGIEHGYIIDAPVHAGDDLVITVDVADGTPAMSGDDVVITRPDDSIVGYRDLYVFDATGAELSSFMAVDGATITLNVDTAGAVYPITVDPTITGDQLLFPLQDAAGDRLGTSVAVDGDAPGGALVVVGAPRDDDQGADNGTVYVFRFGGSSFSQEATIYPTTPTEEGFGTSVDVHGNRIVVGAPGNDDNGTDAGAVHVFDFGGIWSHTSTIYSCDPTGGPCGDTAPGGFDGDLFGTAVGIANDGGNDVIFVGAPGAIVAGSAGGGAFVYEPGGTGWQTNSSRAVANPNATAGDDFGAAVDISANGLNLVVGAPKFDDGAIDEGAAWWFSYDGTVVDAPSRLSFLGFRTEGSNLGSTVAVDVHSSGDIVAFVGFPIITSEPGDGGEATGSANGFAAYSMTGTSGSPQNAFTSSTSGQSGGGEAIVDAFGRALAFDGTSFVVGSPLYDVPVTDGGWVAVYTYSSGPATLTFNALMNLPEAVGDEWGDKVAIDGDFVAAAGQLVDAPFGDAPGTDSGQVAIAQVSNLAAAAQLANGQISNTRDRFGWTVAVDGDRLAVQAPLDDLAGTEAGAVYMYDRADSSSDWVFDAVITSPDPTREDRFGDSLSMLGDRIAIGESDRYGDQAEAGRVFVFERTGPGSWSQVGGEISIAAGYNAFGQSVALHSANRLFIGAPESGTGGEVFVTTETAGVWSAPTALSFSGSPAPVAGDQIGYSIAVDRVNNVLIAGAPGDDDAGADAGAAWFWVDIDTTPAWADVDSSAWNAGNRVGTSVAASPGTYAISGIASALQNDDRQVHLLEDVGGGSFQVFHSIELTLAAGRPNDPNAEIALVGQNLFFGRPGGGGTVEIFRDTDGTGLPTTAVDVFDPPSVSGGAVFGFNVAASGDTLVSGARGDDTQGLNAGVVYTARELGITHNWIGTAGDGDWANPANWDTGLVPDGDDTAIIPDGAGPTISVSATTDVGILVLGSGRTLEIGASAIFTITGGGAGGTSLIDGTLEGLLDSTVTAQAPIDIGASGEVGIDGAGGFQDQVDVSGIFGVKANGSVDLSANIDINSGTVANDGQLVMAGATVLVAIGASVSNTGTWRWSSAAAQEVQISGAVSTFTNTGTIEKAGAGTLTLPAGFDLDMENGSAIEVQAGSLFYAADGTWTGDPAPVEIRVGTSATMTWSGSQTLSGAVVGTGIGAADPGRVTALLTKTWAAPGSVANSLDFGSAAASTDPADYMLGSNGATFAGDAFSIAGFLNVEGLDETFFNTATTTILPGATVWATGLASNNPAAHVTGTGSIVNQGTVVIAASQFGNGAQSFTNQGTWIAQSPEYLSMNADWQSTTTSIIEFRDSPSWVDMQLGAYDTELGLVRVFPGAWVDFSESVTFGADSELEFIIDGASSSLNNYGFIRNLGAAPVLDPGATLSTSGSHAPTPSDTFAVWQCTASTCPLFSTANIPGYGQVQQGDDVVLIANACDTEWTGLGGDTLWTNVANWSVRVPLSGDAVCMDVTGLVNVDVSGDQVVGSFVTAQERININSGATLTVETASTIDGPISISGTLFADGTVTLTSPGGQLIPSAAGAAIDGTVIVDTGARLDGTSLRIVGTGTVLTVDGTLAVNTELTLEDGADVIVNGTFDLDGGSPNVQTVSATAAGSSITVNGTLAKSSTSDATIASANGLALDVTDGAVVDADGGTLDVQSGGSWTGGGIGVNFALESPATVAWGGNQDLSGAFSGSFTTTPGLVVLTGTKTATASTSFGLPDGMLFIDGATLAGTSAFTIDSSVDVDDMTVTADLTVSSPSGELGVASGNITVNGTLTNDRAITGTGLTILFGGTGTIDNNGTITTTENGSFNLVGPTLLSDAGSTLDVLDDSFFSVDTSYTELGRTRVEPGAIAGFYGPLTTFDTGSTVELVIDGSSAVTQDNGQLDVDDAADLVLNGTLETTEVGYTPTSADLYTAITCNVGTCPTFPTTNIGALTQAAVGTDLVLNGPVCDTEWTGATNSLWSEAGNWTSGVPISTDVVCMDVGGGTTVTVDGAQEIDRFDTAQEDLVIAGSLIVNGTSFIDGAVTVNGTLDGAGDIILNGGGTLDGGTIRGLVSIPNLVTFTIVNGTLDGEGAGDPLLANFINDGIVTVTGTPLVISDGASIGNNGTWIFDSAAAQDIQIANPGTSTFDNPAVFRKQGAGTLTMPAGVTFNTGPGSAFEVLAGNVDFFMGGTWTGTPTEVTVRVDTGATLDLAGDQNFTGTISGTFVTAPGKVQLTGTKTSNTNTTLDFPESPLAPGNANGYMLEWAAVDFRGDPWTFDGFAHIFNGSPTSNAQLTIALGADVAQRWTSFTVDGSMLNLGSFRAVGSAFDSLEGSGTWTNRGLFRRDFVGGGTYTINIANWADDAAAGTLEIVDGTAVTINSGLGVSSGTYDLAPGSQLTFANAPEFGGLSVVDIGIDGDSTTTANYGRVTTGGAPVIDSGATLRTDVVGHVPTPLDTYAVLDCGAATCPAFATTDTAPLLQTIVLGDIVLALPVIGPLVVDTASDVVGADGECSLREAILAANNDTVGGDCGNAGGADTITFTTDMTIVIGSPLPAITDDLLIDGEGQDVVIDGAGSHAITSIAGGVAATLDGLVIFDANTQSCPGTTCGAIVSNGDLDVIDSEFVDNTMSGNANGSAITNDGGTLNVTGSLFTGNTSSWAGPIWNRSGTTNVANSTFSGNTAQHAAIYNFAGATLNVWNSTFVDNDATSAVINTAGGGAVTTIRNSIIANVGETNCQLAAGSTLNVDVFNLGIDGTCGSATTVTNAALDLGTLADNGGPTRTVALGVDSSAIGAGDLAVCAAAPVNGVDQRGIARAAGVCDVGAFGVPTHIVNDTGDGTDAIPGDGVCETAVGNGICTFRAALQESNQDDVDVDRIHFDIAGPGVHTISPTGFLPTIRGNVVIDATTEPGADCSAWPPTLTVEVDLAETLSIQNGAFIRGLVINNWSFPSDGVAISGSGVVLECNFIGANATATALSGEGASTVVIDGSGHRIGGPAATQANVIGGSSNTQVFLRADATTIQGNFINTDPSGAPLAPVGGVSRQEAIYVTGSNNQIGGTGAGEGNRIAGVNGQAVQLVLGTGNSIRGNSITGHSGLGIDIDPAPFVGGVTPNDPDDVDGGPNNTQNFPVLTSAIQQGGTTQLTGLLDSTPSRTFEIDVFSNGACDASGNGEGEFYLGTFSVTTDASGDATFDEAFPAALMTTDVVTLTATDMTTGDTSEFSACVTVAAPFVPGPPVVAIDGEWAAVSVPAQQEVFILRNISGVWTDVQTISGAGITGFGEAIALSDPHLAIGAPASGRVDFWERPPGVGTFAASFDQSSLIGYGTSLDISEDGLIVIGSPQGIGGALGSGVANVYDLETGGFLWNTVLGSADDGVGTSVSITETAVYVGAPGSDISAADGGVVYRYDLAGTWQETLEAGAPAVGRGYGTEISATDDRVAIGSIAGQQVAVDPISGPTFGFNQPTGGVGASVAASGDLVVFSDDVANLAVIIGDNGTDGIYSSLSTVAGTFSDVAADGGTVALASAPAATATSGADVVTFVASPIVTPAEKVLPVIGSAGDRFGSQVAIDGDTMVVAAPGADGGGLDAGAIYVFERTGGVWGQTQRMDDQPGLGGSVAVSGDLLVAGTDTGFAVYSRSGFGNPFTPYAVPTVATVSGPPESIAIDGDTLAVGIPSALTFNGEVQVYTGGVTGWTTGSLQTITSNTGKTATDYFGFSADVSGDVLVVGAPLSDGPAPSASGYAEIWTRPDGVSPFTYSLLLEVDIFDDFFGWSVGVDGDRIAVSAPQLSNGEVFVYDTGAVLLGSIVGAAPLYGQSLALDAGVMTVANTADQIDTYDVSGAGPSLIQTDPLPDYEPLDTSAVQVATSGGTVVVGASEEDQQGTNAGAVYMFDLPDPVPANKLESDAGLGRTGYGTGIDIEGDLAYISQSDSGGGGVGASLKPTQRDPLTGTWQTASNLTPGATQVEMSATHVATVGADGQNVRVTPVGGFITELGVTATDPVIDLEGDLLIVGEPTIGQVRIFEWDGLTTWNQVFSTSGTAGTFGSDVAIDGDLAIVANSSNTTAGAVVVYERVAGTWQATPVATLTNPDATTTDDAWFGSSVDLAGTTLVVGHSLNHFPTEDEGVVWVYDGAPSTYATQTPQLLVPSAAGTGDVFGQEVQIDGDFIAVGAPAHNFSGDPFRSGAAFIFGRSGSTWVEVAYLLPEDREGGAQFGLSLSIDDIGSTAISLIGAPFDDNNNGVDAGAIYWYESTAPISPPANKIVSDQPETGEDFGIALDHEGDVLVVGAPGNDDQGGSAGTAYAFVRQPNGAWQFDAELALPPSAGLTGGEDYGNVVAIARDGLSERYLAAIAAPEAGDGEVFIWELDGSWQFLGSVTGDAGELDFGNALDVDDIPGGDNDYVVAVGAPDDGFAAGTGPGAAYVFNVDTTSPTLTLLDKIPGSASTISSTDATGTPHAGFGSDVAFDGDTLLVSAPFNDDAGTDAGAVSVFLGNGALTSFTEQAVLYPCGVGACSGAGGEFFGVGLDLDGDTAVVGATSLGSAIGNVHVFDRTGTTWSATQDLTAATTATDDLFGIDVDIENDVILIGSFAGGASDEGEAFVFRNVSGTWAEESAITGADAVAGDQVGGSVSLSTDGGIVIGSRNVASSGVATAGGAYAFQIIVGDDPTLAFTLGLAPGQTPPEVAGGTGIPISALGGAAPLIEDNADNESSVFSTNLSEVGVAESALSGIPLGATPFGSIATTLPELRDLPILSIGIEREGGWSEILAEDPADYGDLPLVNVTVGQVFGDPDLAGTIGALPFGSIDVNGTPFGSIPFGSIAMGGVPLTDIPVEEGRTDPAEIAEDWCDVLAGTSEECGAGNVLDPGETLMSIALSDVPFGSIPFGSIPFGSIPVEYVDGNGAVQAAPFGSINLSEVAFESTPFGSIPFGSIPFGSIPFGSIPFGSIPFGSIPFGSIPFGSIPFGSIGVGTTPFGSIPFGSIPFGSIDVNGAPFGSIPFGSIALAEVSLDQIPLDPDRTTAPEIEEDWCSLMAEFNLDCQNAATPVTGTTIVDLGVRGVPFGSIPFGSIPFGSIPFGSIPFGSIPFGSIPFGSINLGAIDLGAIDLAGTPFGSIPFGSIGTGVDSIPFGSIDIAGSPFGSILLEDISTNATPFGSIPFGSIPLVELPFGSIPFGSIPFGSIPFGSIGTVADIPFGSIDILGSPFGSIPFGSIPFGSIGSVVDCALVDCENGTLADAVLAGAIVAGATLGDLGSATDNLRIPDIAEYLTTGTPQDLYDAVEAWAIANAITLADLQGYADMTLADLPATNPLFQQTLLGDIQAGLPTVTFLDLALALIVPGVTDPVGALENEVYAYGASAGLTLGDFDTFGDTPFGDLVPALGGTLGDLGAFLAFIHLDDLGFTPTELADALDTAPGTGPGGAWTVDDAIAAGLDLGDMKLADLLSAPEWGAATVADLIEWLPEEEVAGFTFADLLLGLLPPGALPWGLAFENVNASEIPGVMPPVTLQALFDLTGGRDRTIEVSVDLPSNAAYVPGTATITPSLGDDVEPELVDGRLVWTLTGVQPGPDENTAGVEYDLQFDVQPSLSIGSTSIGGDGRIVGDAASVAATTLISVNEAFEPNDTPPGILAVEDTLYLVHISSDSDIDLFHVDIFENDQIAIDLSGLPADFDVVLYSESTGPVSSTALTGTAGGDPLVPVLDPDADGTETLPDQSFPRLDLENSNISLVEISNSRGTEDETIVTDRLPGGRYIIQVHGHDGATSVEPAVLQVQVVEAEDVPPCQARGALPAATPGATVDFNTLPADLNTVFLVNEQRLEQLFEDGTGSGATARTDVVNALNNLVGAFGSDPEISTLGLVGAVIPVDGFQSVRDAYDFWDDPAGNGGAIEDACDPATANAIVSTIIGDILDPIRVGRDIEHIVMIGSDDMMPFARLTDATVVANEFDYRHDLTGRNAFTSSFWASTILSDDPYGETAAVPYGDRFIYLPDAALGRVLEDPEQIVDQINQFIAFDGFLNADTGLVAGYDFLIDGSEAISGELAVAIPGSGLNDELADGIDAGGELWSADDIVNTLLADATPADPNDSNGPDIVSFNAHFDHYRALPAIGDQVAGFNDNFEVTEITGLAPNDELLDGSLIYSMGCHSGLNVPDTSFGITGVLEDWAQAFTDQQAVYVGNTGFGYGDTETVGYTERLLQLFSRNLAQPLATDLLDPSTITTIGQALQFAKQETFAELPDVSVYHEKALQESTMYGLPFYRLGVAPTLAPAPPDNQPVIDPLTGDPAVVYLADAENVTNTVGTAPNEETYFSNVNDAGDPTTVTQPGRPIQPTLVVDVTDADPADPTQLESEARGAIILDMTSSYVTINPVVSVPVFDESSQAVEPEIDGIVYPTVPQTISTRETPAGTRQQLVLATGQYRGTEDLGVQRLDDDIDVVVYYSNDADVSPPSILEVDSQLNGFQLTITADVDPGSGTAVDRVYVLVTPEPGAALAEWFGVELVETSAGRWAGGITFGGVNPPTDIEFLVQAKDEAGNVGVSTNKAVNFGEEEIPPPVAVTLTTSVSAVPPGGVTNGIYTGDVLVDADAQGLPVTYSLDGQDPLDLPTGGITVTGDGIHTVEFLAADGQTETVIFTIDTSPPSVTISQPLNGQVFTLGDVTPALFSCLDPAGATCTGDVGGTTVLSGDDLPTGTVGTFILEVTAVDALGISATESVSYSVQAPIAAEPEITMIDGPAVPQNIVDGIFIDVDFDDGDGAFDTYEVTIDFGDADEDDPSSVSTTCVVSSAQPITMGNPNCELVDEPDASGGGLVASNFTYAEPGVYTVTVTVEDSAGNVDTSVFEFAVVYDPAAGRVSGAGWFWSGDEAYDDPDPWGEWAFFGYRARYRNNEPTPRGKTRLHLLGEFYFRSTSYDYLIINDTMAVAEGTGRIGSDTGYRFRVQGVDNGWIDFFQITIWDDATGEILYDNGVLFDQGDIVLFGGIRVRS